MYKELAFISYYFHWSNDEVMKLDHFSRRKWCTEISLINSVVNPSDKNKKEKSILDFGKG